MYCTHVACISDLTYSKHKHRTGWLGRPMNMASTSKTPQQCKTWSIALLGGGQTLIKIKMLSMVFKYWTITLQEKILLDSTVWNESCWWNIDGISRGISQLGKIHMWHPFICLGLLYKRNAFSGGPCSKAKANHSKALYALGVAKFGSLSQFFWPPLFWKSSRICVECFVTSTWIHLERCKTWQLHWTLPKWPVVAIPILPDLGPPSSLEPGNCIICATSNSSILNLPQNSIQHIHQDHPSPKEALFAIFSPINFSNHSTFDWKTLLRTSHPSTQ